MMVGMAYVKRTHIKHSKEELACTIDKQLRLVVIKCYLKELRHKETKE